MAYNCAYTTNLTIYHGTRSAVEIAESLPTLQPCKAVSVGDPTRKHPNGEQRFASNTVWAARLHQANELQSDDVSIDDFLSLQVDALAIYRDVFWDLKRGGEVNLELHLKLLGTYYTVLMISPQTLQSLGDLGLHLVVEVSYFPEQTN